MHDCQDTYQYSEAGDVDVIGLRKSGMSDCAYYSLPTGTYVKVMDPVNLLESVAPNVNSPLVLDSEVVGSNETATKFDDILPWLKRLSVTIEDGQCLLLCETT